MALAAPMRRVRRIAKAVKQAAPKMSNPLMADMYAHAVEQAADHNNMLFLEFMSNLDQPPVDIEEFLDSPEFLGATDLTLWPEVRRSIIEMNKEWWKGPDHAKREAILSGATGTGKTEISKVDAAYTLHILHCLKNPQVVYGLPSATSILLVIQSAKPHVTKKVVYSPLRTYIENIPWFQQFARFDPYVESEMMFNGKNIRIVPAGADADAILGEAIIWALLDEANFMPVVLNSKRADGGSGRGGLYDQAAATHAAVTRRRNSRFVYHGPQIGKIIVASSSLYEHDFTSKREAAARAATNRKHFFVYHKMRFEVMPQEKFSGKTFKAAILNDITGEVAFFMDGEEPPDHVHEVIEIPMEYHQDFTDDPLGALRDICGKNVSGGIAPFFRRRDKIAKYFENGEKIGLESILVKDNVILGLDGMPMVVKGHRAPMPKRPRYVHIDLSLNQDSCGVSMVRFDGFVDVTRHTGVVEKLPLATVEISCTIKPDSLTEIDIAEVRAWVQQLKNKYKYPIKAVTYDGWMSQESIQAWRKSGMKSGRLSVDKTTGPYKALREALYDERLRGYYQPVITQEMTELEYDEKKDKVDHPPSGSKDGLDAVCGAYNSMLKRSRLFSEDGNEAADDEEYGDRPDLGDRYGFDDRA